jgi:hypothetical protein
LINIKIVFYIAIIPLLSTRGKFLEDDLKRDPKENPEWQESGPQGCIMQHQHCQDANTNEGRYAVCLPLELTSNTLGSLHEH